MRYTLAAGRAIVKDGVTVATIHRVGNDCNGYALTPAEADALARGIVASLNVYIHEIGCDPMQGREEA